MKFMNNKLIGVLNNNKTILFIVIVLLSSCVPQSKILYLQDMEKDQNQTQFDVVREDYKIKPGDDLYIRVLSFDEESAAVFNQLIGNNSISANVTTGTGYMVSFTVNDSGYIEFPLIGKIDVINKTIDEITIELNVNLSEYISLTTVIVKLMNFKITVLGEVNRPGQIEVMNDKITIFEAIGLVGDLDEYGNRKEVQLLREKDGEANLYIVDLTDKKLIESEYYYLQPDDVIYVPPMASKAFGLRQFQLPTFLSLVTSIFAILLYVQSFQN